MELFSEDTNNPYIGRVYNHGYEIYFNLDDSGEFHQLDIEVKKNTEVVAEGFFVCERENFHGNDVEVNSDHRRKGIATAMYVTAEKIMGKTLVNYWDESGESQTEMGQVFWGQKNRPFGKKT